MIRVLSNTALSVDGRIATVEYDHFALGTRLDRAYMSVLRARADAVLVGGRTFRNWPLPLVPDPAALAELRAAAFFDADTPAIDGRRWINAVVTRGGVLPETSRFWSDPRVDPVVYASTAGPTDPPSIVADLERRGVTTLLLECGGDLLSQWLAAGLVHDVYVTICPLLLGGRGAPSLVDGSGFGHHVAPRLHLEHCRAVGDELFCRYRVLR